MRIWRISNHADLSGRGGMLVDGRWHRRGRPVLYCSDHPSTALLEVLVHVTLETIPSTYQLLEIEAPDGLPLHERSPTAGWKDDIAATQSLGDAFLRDAVVPLMRVPSVVMPKAFNLLVNPRHADAAKLTLAETYRYPFDSRLLR